MREQARRRQKGTSLVKIASWALYNKSHLTSLVDAISKLLDFLEKTFPAPEVQSSLAQSEIREICDLTQGQQDATLSLLYELSKAVDKTLQAQATKMIEQKGISIGSLVVAENARVRDGNFYGSAWKGETIPTTSSNIRIDSIHVSGTARVMNGDMYGDKDNFFD
jgi:hypothetical protein